MCEYLDKSDTPGYDYSPLPIVREATYHPFVLPLRIYSSRIIDSPISGLCVNYAERKYHT